MKPSAHRARLLASLIAVLLAAITAHAVPVTFQVRMGLQIELGNFDPVTDSVDVAGTFNGWGSSPLTPLADADHDSVYAVTVDGFTPGEYIEYKFRYDGAWDGREEFPGYGSNRVYTVQADGNLIDVWYNDFAPGGGGGEVGELHWWNDAVFYEIFVRSFSDSDGDGIGDFQGLTAKLDYLNDGDPATDTDLGVTGLWLMPINDSPSYHGYDSVDYRSINPDYGTLADFQTFLAAAHARGIKVIIDYVMNHCSSQHPWFTASKQNDPTYRDWFRWSPSNPDQTGPWGQNVWHWNSSGWYYGLFGGGMPDLNYDTPAVKDAMFDTAAWWLDTVGVDGFRLDAVLYLDEDGGQLQNTPGTLQLWQDFNARVKAANPAALTVGEAWAATSTVIQYVIDDRLDLCFEFDLSYAALGAVNDGDAGYLAGKAAQVYGLYPYLQYATFLTNHDQNRTFDVLGRDEGKARAAAGLYLTLPGVPFVYYGEEIGMVGSKPDETIRTPMQWTDGPAAGFTTGTPWQPLNSNYAQYNVQTEEQDGQSLLEWYKRLIHVRNDAPALRRGTFAALSSTAPAVLAFVRQYETQTLLCLVNTSGTAQAGFDVTSTGLAAGPVELINHLDPGDTLSRTLDVDGVLDTLSLNGHETAVYEIVWTTGAVNTPRTGLRLEPAFPNPFNPSTTFRYTLTAPARVRIGVYDLAGREVAVLRNAEETPGTRTVSWDGKNASGRDAPSGVYHLCLDADGENRRAKLTLVR